MGKRDREIDAIRLYADGTEIPDIAKISKKEGWYVSENTLRDWKKKAGPEWDDARAAARKSSLVNMEDVGSRLRRSREIASQLMGDSKDQGAVGMVLNQALQTGIHDLIGQIQTINFGDDDAVDRNIERINKLTLSLGRTEQSASINQKREREIRKDEREKALQDAADAVKDATSKAPIGDNFQYDPKTLDYIQTVLYGLKPK
jgi:hypothetical protein